MIKTMDLVIFEDSIKYDWWIKVVLALSVVLLIVLGVLFDVDARDSDIFPGEPAAESRMGSFVLFAAAVFLLAVYWLILPRTIAISQEGLILRFRAFSWNIPFATIRSVNPASGMIVWWAHSWITSYRSQIEIIRKYRLKIRVSPSRRDQFLEYAHKAFADWKSTHPA
jgi:protein-S-isoprenylcysteine O-methyltransferase Ste14